MSESPRPPRERYEDFAFGTVALLWRRRRFIALSFVVGVIIAGLVVMSIPNRYTADAVIQVRIARQDPQLQSNVTVDAASVIATEANLVRSPEIAERVMRRLGLAENPDFVRASIAGRALAFIKFWKSAPPSDMSRIAAKLKLMKGLDVANDMRSFLIRIAFTSPSSEQSAQITNAFAEEYIRARNEAAARRQLADLDANYGPKHPLVLKAESQLREALRSSSISDAAQILTRAVPPISPSGPDRPLNLLVGFFASLMAAIVIVLTLDRANTSFRTEAELVSQAKAPCLGIFPEGMTGAGLEAGRAIAMAAGLATQPASSKVLLVTCSVPQEGEFLVTSVLGRTLADMGRRTLTIDLSREAPKIRASSDSRSPAKLLNGMGRHPRARNSRNGELLALQTAPKSPEKQTQATSQQVLRLIEQARQQYDSTIIIAPPILMSADALCLGRLADFVLHVVRWNSTPRRAVVTALERLSSFGIRLDGVLISRVPHKEYRRLTGVDAELGKSFADRFFAHRGKRALSAKPS